MTLIQVKLISILSQCIIKESLERNLSLDRYTILDHLKEEYERMERYIIDNEHDVPNYIKIENTAEIEEATMYTHKFMIDEKVVERIAEQSEKSNTENNIDNNNNAVDFRQLSSDVSVDVLSYLPVTDLMGLSHVSKSYHSWILENEETRQIIWKELVHNQLKDHQIDDASVEDWKQYFIDLYYLFDPSAYNKDLKDGIIQFNHELQGLWSHRVVYDLSQQQEFSISFEFFLETGDADLVVLFSSTNGNSSDALQFRISGESDMTGTNVKCDMLPEYENSLYYSENKPPITFGKWYTINLQLTMNLFKVSIDGKPVFADIQLELFPTRGYVGIFHSSFRPDPIYIRKITGTFQHTPLFSCK